MRIAALSDIHGNLPALEAVLDDVAGAGGADVTVNLGDILSGPLWPVETAERLMALDLPTIRGNHERQVLTFARGRMGQTDGYTADHLGEVHRQWMRGLPETLWLSPEVFCCHGTPDSDLVYWLETVTPDHGRDGSRGLRMASTAEALHRLGGFDTSRVTLMLCGHTHMPRLLQLPAGGPLVVNPGSVGLQGFDDDHPFAHVLEVGSPHARWALIERTEAGWNVQQRAVAYDWESAARRAEANGRPDWADALRTGFVGRFEADAEAAK
jgi:predicted phosphodiesterase